MQAGHRYTIWQTLRWTRRYVIIFILYGSIPVILFQFTDISWIHIPWEPISLIGIAVAFYLGFKNNSAYDRLWEARKIWGGIVNTSRSFTVMARDFVNNETAHEQRSHAELKNITRSLVHRHVAWLRAMSIELRQTRAWERTTEHDDRMRKLLGTYYSEERFEEIRPYLDEEEFDYVKSKGNRSSHLLSSQSKHIMQLRQEGVIEHFRHLEMQALVTEMYTLQGQCERIKNFPFPRQYASINYFFVVLFIALLPFAMLDVFTGLGADYWVWYSIPFSVTGSWVFWMMEMIGEYSENPFQGLHNDVPISSLAQSIEIDIRQMIEDENIPEPMKPMGALQTLV